MDVRDVIADVLYEHWGGDPNDPAWTVDASAILLALRLMPVEERMIALGMQQGPCLFCGVDPDIGGSGCADGNPHSFVWIEDADA